MWMLSNQRDEMYQILNDCPRSKPGNPHTIFVFGQMALCWASRRCQMVCARLVEEVISSYGSTSSLEKQQLLPIAATESIPNMLLLQFFVFFLCHSVPSQTLQPKYFFPLSHFLTLLLTSLAFLLFPLFFLYFSTNVILTYINLLEFSIFIPCVLVMTLICCLVTTFLNYVMEKMTFPLDICSTMELLFVPKNVNRGTISTYFCITMMTRYSKV